MSQQRRSRTTVDRVLQAAAVVFAKHGIRGGSIHTIAKRSHVSIGSIYHHFKSRDGVAVALYQQQLDRLLAFVGAAYLQATTAKTALFALVDAYLGWVHAHPQAARFLFFAGPAELHANQNGALDATKMPRLMPIAARAQAYAQAGWLRPLPLHVLEVVVVGPVSELARRSLSGAAELVENEVVEHIKDAIWRSIAVDPTSDGSI